MVRCCRPRGARSRIYSAQISAFASSTCTILGSWALSQVGSTKRSVFKNSWVKRVPNAFSLAENLVHIGTADGMAPLAEWHHQPVLRSLLKRLKRVGNTGHPQVNIQSSTYKTDFLSHLLKMLKGHFSLMVSLRVSLMVPHIGCF